MKLIVDKISSLKIDVKKLLKISVIIIFVGAFMSFVVPQITYFIVKQTAIFKPGHLARSQHEKGLLFTYKFYLWNVTNPKEITAGTQKPKMQEVGPYVFTQYKYKIDVKDNKTADSYSFNAWNVFHFDPHLTAPLTGDEPVTMLNVVLGASLTLARIEMPHLFDTAVEGLNVIFENPATMFISMTAKQFIDDGISVNCNQTALAAKAVCREMRKYKELTLVNGDKTRLQYRWFAALNHTLTDHFTVLRGSKNVADVGRIIAFNNEPMLNVFKHEQKCNIIKGTEKSMHPPTDPKTSIDWIYSPDACKSLPLEYKYKKRVNGLATAWKEIYLSNPLLDPICECNNYTGCNTIKGTLDMRYCRGFYILGSFPHFYLADASIREMMEGMNPKEELHKVGIYVELSTGTPILALERFQVNFHIKRIPGLPLLNSIDGDLVIPWIWYEESFSLPKSNRLLIIFTKTSLAFNKITGSMMLGLGILGCILAAYLHYKPITPHTTLVVVQPALSDAVTETISSTNHSAHT